MLQSAHPRREQLLLFARNFLKHPRMLGSLIPSSRFLIDEVLQAVDWANARVIVEYGPGGGYLYRRGAATHASGCKLDRD